MGAMRSLYTVLGLSAGASDLEIKAAYRRLAVKYHPDTAKGDPAKAAEKFREVQEAYDVLSDPESRSEYDATGRYTRVAAAAPVDEAEAQLTAIFVDLMDRCTETDMEMTDPMEVVRANVRRSLGQLKEEARRAREHAASLERRAVRVGRIDDRENYIKEALLQKAEVLRAQVDRNDQAQALGDRILKLTQCYQYDAGARRLMSPQQELDEMFGEIMSEITRGGRASWSSSPKTNT